MLGQSLDDLGKAYKSLGNKTDNWKTKTINAFKSISVARKAAAEEALRNSFNWGEDGSDIGNANKSSIEEWTDQRNAGNKSGMEKAYNNASKAVREYIDVTDEAKVSTDGFKEHQQNLINNLGKSNVAARAAAVGMKILKAAMSMAIMAALQFAIQKLVEGFDYLIHMQDKLNEKAEEARKQYEETTEELNTQEEELSKVKAQLAALDSIENPTLADEAQTEELKAQNKELEQQIAYLKEKQEIEEEAARKAADEAWENAHKSGLSNSYDASGNKLKWYQQGWLVDLLSNIGNATKSASDVNYKLTKPHVDYSEIDAATSAMEKLTKAREEYEQIINNPRLSNAEKFEQLEDKKKEIDDLKANLVEINGHFKDSSNADARDFFEQINEAISGTTEQTSQSQKTLKNYADTIDNLFNEETDFNKTNFSIFFDDNGNLVADNIDVAFNGASEELKDNISTVLQQYKDGALGAEQAKQAFAAALALESVKIDSKKVVADFQDAFGGAVEGVDGLINSYDELDATLKRISETYDLVNGALEEQNQNGSISIETALNLAKSGANYADCLEVTAQGIRVKESATKEMVEAQISATKASVDQALAEAEVRLALLNLAVGMQPVAEATKTVLGPALEGAGSAAAYLASLLDSISNKNYEGMFDRASIAADTAKAKIQDASNSVSSALSDSISSQIIATENEIESLKNMQGMIDNLNYSNYKTKYSSSSSSSSSKSSSSSSSSDDPRLEAWNEMLATKKHQLEMDQITEEQYYAWLEANYKKQLNNQKKYLDEWRQYEEEIYKWKKQKRLDDWNDAVDTKKHELEMGKIDEGEYYEWLARNYKSYLKDNLEEYRKYQEEIHKFEEQQGKESQDALEELIDLRVDMLKQEKENEKDVLKERQDNVKEFYDKQRDLLKEHYDKIDKEEERREKRKNVTDIQAELLELEADDSVEAQKRRLELEEELADAKKDLNDFERDEELEQAEKMYDDLEEMQTEYYDRQIEAIEDYLDDAYALRQQAIKDLQNGNAQLYQEMIEYNRQYGSTIDSDITEKWDAAYEALNRYNELLDDDYGIKLQNMTGNTSKHYTPADKIPESKPTTTNKKPSTTNKKSSTATKAKSGPNVGDRVTVKKTATNFSPQSGSVKMNKSVPGGTYTVYQLKGNQVLIGVPGKGYTGWVYKSDLQGYAKGTSNAKGGLAVVNEEGLEYILGSPSKGKYQFLNNGDKVFNAKASEFLYKWANEPAKILGSMIKSISASSSIAIASPCNITVGDINISGNADEKTVGELRRVRKELITDILNEFKKIKK